MLHELFNGSSAWTELLEYSRYHNSSINFFFSPESHFHFRSFTGEQKIWNEYINYYITISVQNILICIDLFIFPFGRSQTGMLLWIQISKILMLLSPSKTITWKIKFFWILFMRKSTFSYQTAILLSGFLLLLLFSFLLLVLLLVLLFSLSWTLIH